jgi:hypothetical protein
LCDIWSYQCILYSFYILRFFHHYHAFIFYWCCSSWSLLITHSSVHNDMKFISTIYDLSHEEYCLFNRHIVTCSTSNPKYIKQMYGLSKIFDDERAGDMITTRSLHPFKWPKSPTLVSCPFRKFWLVKGTTVRSKHWIFQMLLFKNKNFITLFIVLSR